LTKPSHHFLPEPLSLPKQATACSKTIPPHSQSTSTTWTMEPALAPKIRNTPWTYAKQAPNDVHHTPYCSKVLSLRLELVRSPRGGRLDRMVAFSKTRTPVLTRWVVCFCLSFQTLHHRSHASASTFSNTTRCTFTPLWPFLTTAHVTCHAQMASAATSTPSRRPQASAYTTTPSPLFLFF